MGVFSFGRGPISRGDASHPLNVEGNRFDDVIFKTKPELAVEMLEHAWASGVPMAWILAHLSHSIDITWTEAWYDAMVR